MCAVKEEAERGQDPGASAQPAESPGVYRSLRKRPNLNYAQAAGDLSPAVQLAECPTPILFGKHNIYWQVTSACQDATSHPTESARNSLSLGDEDSESDASSSSASEEEGKKAAPKQQATEPRKGQRGRKRRTEPIVVTKEDGTREEVSPQVYRRLRR